MSIMTLSSALHLAIDPATTEEGIAAMVAMEVNASSTPAIVSAAEVLLFVLGRADWVRGWIPLMRPGMINHGANLIVLELPQSDPSWVAAAESLASWADAQRDG